jgi:transposase
VLTRTRTTLIDERSAVVNRLHKVLEDANLKLSGVASDILGVFGRAMIESILAGASDPKALADLAKGRLRQKREELQRALTGQVTAHHRLLLTMHLAHIDFLNEQITAMSAEIAERLRPFEAELARLDTIPGVGRSAAEVILAELGTTMGQFPSAAHAASWAGMCPGNHESAGKHKGVRSRRGSVWLRRARPLRVSANRPWPPSAPNSATSPPGTDAWWSDRDTIRPSSPSPIPSPSPPTAFSIATRTIRTSIPPNATPATASVPASAPSPNSTPSATRSRSH